VTWLRSVESLARSSPAPLADAQHHLRELVGLARALAPAVASAHVCGTRTCPFAAHPLAADLCALVAPVATLDVAAVPVAGSGEAVAARFVDRVREASDVVRWCRQTAHPGSSCWFTSPDGPGCAQVLKLSHRLTD
jgi:hypothetical protein